MAIISPLFSIAPNALLSWMPFQMSYLHLVPGFHPSIAMPPSLHLLALLAVGIIAVAAFSLLRHDLRFSPCGLYNYYNCWQKYLIESLSYCRYHPSPSGMLYPWCERYGMNRRIPMIAMITRRRRRRKKREGKRMHVPSLRPIHSLPSFSDAHPLIPT